MYGGNELKAQQTYGGYPGGFEPLIQKIAPEPPRASELVEQMAKLETALAFAEDSLNEAFTRLQPVTRASPPEENAARQQLVSCGPCTQYGSQVADASMRVGRIGERIQDLLRRLEV